MHALGEGRVKKGPLHSEAFCPRWAASFFVCVCPPCLGPHGSVRAFPGCHNRIPFIVITIMFESTARVLAVLKPKTGRDTALKCTKLLSYFAHFTMSLKNYNPLDTAWHRLVTRYYASRVHVKL